MERHLYHTLGNIVPSSLCRDLRQPEDYICDQHGSIFLNVSLKPGEYRHFDIIGYAKFHQQMDGDDIVDRHPHLKEWIAEQWPRPIGRYHLAKCQVVDVIFNPIVDRNWSIKERDEWSRGTYGYYQDWIYDLRSAPLAAVVMGYVNEIPPTERTPTRVVRHILAAADVCNREDALLHGQWKGPYKDGTHPTAWRRVMDIYLQRYKTGKAVKYAQCWVYSEILTCAFRFLGLPARTVYATNAHIDRHRDGGIDLGFVVSKGNGSTTTERIAIDVTSLLAAPVGEVDVSDELSAPVPLLRTCSSPLPPGSPISPSRWVSKGGISPKAIPIRSPPFLPLPDEDVKTLDVQKLVGADDGVWNFHVWNEVYLERPDLRAPYHVAAWQCLDASPVVATDTVDDYAGKHIFGPCSTLNLKDGINLPHDFRYLYSAVNSVYRYWRCSKDIYYVDNISYSCWDRTAAATKAGVTSQSTVVVTRDPEKSHMTTVVDRDITANYTPATPHQAYEIHHAHHPILFVIKRHLLHATMKHDGSYYIQICCLGTDGKLLSCHRQQVITLKELSAPHIPDDAKRVSTLIVKLDTKQWWVQVLPV